jgi:hypothetical protein
MIDNQLLSDFIWLTTSLVSYKKKKINIEIAKGEINQSMALKIKNTGKMTQYFSNHKSIGRDHSERRQPPTPTNIYSTIILHNTKDRNNHHVTYRKTLRSCKKPSNADNPNKKY